MGTYVARLSSTECLMPNNFVNTASSTVRKISPSSHDLLRRSHAAIVSITVSRNRISVTSSQLMLLVLDVSSPLDRKIYTVIHISTKKFSAQIW
mmetsp:Transcript_28511/g.51656  ORF Transcript_28511/g.51656 Transcript_28511/m.51656 type:complete len:94 (+) Transcript_28511:3743-4024(+)